MSFPQVVGSVTTAAENKRPACGLDCGSFANYQGQHAGDLLDHSLTEVPAFVEVNWDFRSWRCQVEVCAVTEADLCSPCHPQRLRLVRPLLLNETVQSLFGEQAFTRQVSQPPEDRRG